MEFMLLFMFPAGAPTPEPDAMAEMGRFVGELRDRKKLRRGAPLAGDAEGARVRKRGGKALVVDGPFAESKEVVAGFWIVDVADRAEAIDVAVRCPHSRDHLVEVHPVDARYLYADSERGTPYLLAFLVEPGFEDCGGEMRRTMLTHADALAAEGTLLETTPLAATPPPARVTRKGGKPLVVDGPFAETKEVVGGYSLVRAPDRAAAIALARDYPHAQWGTVEVREILFFDRI
jgi:hypothetical protein